MHRGNLGWPTLCGFCKGWGVPALLSRRSPMPITALDCCNQNLTISVSKETVRFLYWTFRDATNSVATCNAATTRRITKMFERSRKELLP
jgi:hypothetical protein